MPAKNAHGFYQTSRAHFRQLIFRTVLKRGPISRQKISSLLHLRYVTLQGFVTELLNEKIIKESGNVVVRRGRAPIFLTVNPDGGRVVGIAMTADEISAVLFGLDMVELQAVRQRTEPGASAESLQRTIFDLIERLLHSPEGRGHKLWGIGFGEYGLYDTQKGVTLRSTCYENWHGVPIQKLLHEHFAVPVRVNSSERCELLCERLWGAAREARTAVFLDVQEGIGFAVLDKGELLSGASGFAGEIGHIQMVQDGEMCLCGGRGCLETVASTRAIVERVRQGLQRGIRSDLAAKPLDSLTIQDIVEAASHGDSFSANILNGALVYLGSALAIAINLYNPDTILLRGELFRHGGGRLLEIVRREADGRALREFHADIQWHVAETQNSAARGAAALVFENLLEVESTIPDIAAAPPPEAAS